MPQLKILPKRLDVLDVNDPGCQFRINIDVLNEAFGVDRSMYAKACYPDRKNVYFSGNNIHDQFFIWMPKLYSNSSEWENTLSSDGIRIYEVNEPEKQKDSVTIEYECEKELRLVFVKDTPKAPYRFAGVFKSDIKRNYHREYVRIASRIKLIGDPVYKVELLDDNR